MSVTEIPELRIELAPAAEAVERACRKLADLLSAAEEPERDVHGLEWTLHELVAHLAGRSGRFAAYPVHRLRSHVEDWPPPVEV